jgi:hypothetical protein
MEVAIATMFGIRTHVIVPNISWGLPGMHECDLFVIPKSGCAKEVEIKRSKSDFLADFKKGHNHVDRQKRISEFYYAFPADLVDKCIDLVPENAGIIVCERYKNYRGIESVRASIKRKAKWIKDSRKLTLEEQFKIARLGCMRIWGLKQKLNKK